MNIRPALSALFGAVALMTGLVVSSGTAFADTASCTNAQAAVAADQAKLNVDQARLSNDPATIPDPNHPGQVITNPAVATDQATVNADRGQLASDQSAVTIACGSTTTPSPTTTPVPWPHGGNDIVCTSATSCTQNGQPYTGSVAACTSFPCRLDANGQLDNDPARPHWHPGIGGLNGNYLNGLGLGGLTVLNGNTIVLGNQQVDVCTVPNWQSFYNRYNPYFGSLRAQLNELRYEQLLALASCPNNSGFNGLTLVNGQWINLAQYGVVGGQQVSVCEYPTYTAFDQFGLNRFGPNFNPFVQHFGGYLAGPGWNQLRLRANCQPVVVTQGSNTTTVVQAPATATQAPAATPEAAAPQTAQSPAQVSHVPTGSVDTGDGSAPDVN